ncbi:Cobyrinic acid a,c-diamide synthase [Desulforamulus reducens MI-1]|uniref:Cobyrinic acid a,c-diamide synthase n=1 Tax=Desulforamulus reducens (strain ATCC BAA-1160 / DSM 100696 / MI-1) TaxID=349161 RepID=A4J293_DESRM|nr:ATP-binding protein [Desulforamulus reducens]ABO49196.1 Cobyrinic acid a,c-diamide synthase [Desulforamulus reducens MI-1]
MKELTVISGKGGTGKTSILGSFATLSNKAVICDCDVDAANLHLLLKPDVQETHSFIGGVKANINLELCSKCGSCEELCRFSAIKERQVNPYACEGCGLCYGICPSGAITLNDHQSGHWYVSETQWGPMVHAKLGIAEGNSGLLVSAVRKRAREIATERDIPLIISDGPPGIGCPVISSLAGTDMALIVTEPTRSGLHDMERIIQVAATFGCQAAVCINKYDLDTENCFSIEAAASKLDVPVIGKIPYNQTLSQSLLQGTPVTLLGQNEGASAITKLWQQVTGLLGV